MNIAQSTALLSLIFVLIGCDQQDVHQEAKEQMDLVSKQIVKKSIDRYEIVKNSGNSMDACIHAGIVKSAMLAAQDETGYLKWETIEKNDCEKARTHK
ncbi:hypothetical protein [Sulfuricurvum sp.]|uniref:hypothetical protein n=1 Tax=Sulfuricurvum sp. TaxID=2025608 RepID=UPI002D5C3385|nr:hypothetical protein [Sulfuricurvum sp.]HZF69920.1 hypothetical protein [Sulfuricurvum sp.]